MTSTHSPVVHEFTATDPIHALVQNLRGDITLRAEPGTAVRVELTPRGEAGRELAEAMRVSFEDDRLRVDAPADGAQQLAGPLGDLFRGLGGEANGTRWTDRLNAGLGSLKRSVTGLTGSLDITVLVPAGSRTVLHDGAGDVHVHGALAEIDARTGAGDLHLERAAGGATRLTTGTGDITVVGAGPVDPAADATITATTGTGDVQLGRSTSRTSVTTGVGDIHVRRALSGGLAVRSGVGDVTIDVAPGTATHLDLATGLGGRHVDLTPADGESAAVAERTLEIQARTGTGDLRIRRAAADAAGPEADARAFPAP